MSQRVKLSEVHGVQFDAAELYEGKVYAFRLPASVTPEELPKVAQQMSRSLNSIGVKAILLAHDIELFEFVPADGDELPPRNPYKPMDGRL